MSMMTIKLCIKILENKKNARQYHLGYLHTEADSHLKLFKIRIYYKDTKMKWHNNVMFFQTVLPNSK